MSQTAITLAFEQWKAQQATTGEPVLLDEFIFALVPGLDPSLPVDRSETLPPAAQIVHRESVTRKGVVNENAVVHSAVLGADVGDFSFNWIGLTNKATGTLAMIVHAPEQQKLKTKEGQQGNVLTRSFLMEYTGAQSETAINTPAETWQIDFTARMAGIDERQRLENIDLYGAAAFLGDGWLVGKTGNQYFVTKGAGYVAGLRAVLAANQNITVTTKPVKIWLDVCWTGALTSVWAVQSKVTVAANLADYELNGVKHYVFALASIDASGNITDLRPKGTLGEQQGNSDFARKDKNLSDLKDKKQARENLELKSAALREVTSSRSDTTSGNVLQVGDYGLGVANGSIEYLRSIYDIKCSGFYNALGNGTSAPTAGIPGDSGNTSFSVSAGNIYGNQYLVTLTSNVHFYVGLVNTAEKTSTWSKFYNTLNKPAATDVDAVSASQGGIFQKQVQFNQPAYFTQGMKFSSSENFASIGYGADAASFDNANLLLKSWYGIGFYSTYPGAAELGVMGYVDVRLGRLTMKEQVIPGRYDNFDARYQAKGNYTPAGQAYTKAESDGRFQKINTASKAANGWYKDTNTGMIFQWGTATLNSNPSTISFPISFPNSCFKVFATDVGNGTYGYGASPISKSQARIYTPMTGTQASFFAIGN